MFEKHGADFLYAAADLAGLRLYVARFIYLSM
jgi:hypothetical protein